jgi:hypothetical protein
MHVDRSISKNQKNPKKEGRRPSDKAGQLIGQSELALENPKSVLSALSCSAACNVFLSGPECTNCGSGAYMIYAVLYARAQGVDLVKVTAFQACALAD